MPERTVEELESEIEKLEEPRDMLMKFLEDSGLNLFVARRHFGSVSFSRFPKIQTSSDVAAFIDSQNSKIDRLQQKIISLNLKSLLSSSQKLEASSRMLETLTKRLDRLTIILIIATVIIAGTSLANLFHLREISP